MISTAKLAAEISAQEANPIKAETLEGYLQILRDLMVVEDLEPWAPHLRSSYVVRASGTEHLRRIARILSISGIYHSN